MVNELPKILRSLRGQARYSIRELAQASKISHSYIAQLEAGAIDRRSGKPMNPSPEVFRRISSVLGGDSYQLLMKAAGYWQKTPLEMEVMPLSLKTDNSSYRFLEANPRAVWPLPIIVVIFHRISEALYAWTSPSVPELAYEQKNHLSEILHTAVKEALISTSSTDLDALWHVLEVDKESPSRLLAKLASLFDGESNPAYRSLVDALRFKEESKLAQAIESCEDALRRATNPVLIGDIDRLLGWLYSQDFQYRRAIPHLRMALKELDGFLTSQDQARLCTEIGWLYCLVDSCHDAIGYFEKAIENLKIQRSETKKPLLDALHGMATAHSYLGNFGTASECNQKAYAMAKDSDDEDGLAWSTFALGMDFIDMGEWDSAERLMSEVLEMSRRCNLKVLEAICLNEMGCLFLWRGNDSAALESCSRSLTINRSNNFVWGIPHSYFFLAKIHAERIDNNWDSIWLALHNLMEAIRGFTALGCDYRLMDCYADLAEIYLKINQLDQALEAAYQSIEIANKRSYRLGQVIANRLIGSVCIKKNDFTGAQEALTRSLNTAEEIKQLHELAKTYYSFALLEVRRNRFSIAQKFLSRAKAIFSKLKSKPALEKSLILNTEIGNH